MVSYYVLKNFFIVVLILPERLFDELRVEAFQLRHLHK